MGKTVILEQNWRLWGKLRELGVGVPASKNHAILFITCVLHVVSPHSFLGDMYKTYIIKYVQTVIIHLQNNCAAIDFQ